MRTVAAVLSVALLVVLAGCGSAASDVTTDTPMPPGDSTSPSGENDRQGSSSSTADVDTSDLSVPAPPAESFPVGTSVDGITDPTAIMATHLGHLESTSYTSTRTETYATSEYAYSTTNRRSVDGPRQLISVDYSGQSQEVYRGGNASPNYIRWETEQGVRYLIDQGDALFLGESTFFVQSVLEAAKFEFVVWGEIGDHSVFVFDVTGFEPTGDLVSSTPLDTIDELQGTVAVRDDGLILELAVVLTGADAEDIRTELRIEQALSGLGTTTVTEPSWLAAAEKRAAVMTGTLDVDRRYIEITMEHGDEIPAGTQGYIYVGDIALETVFEAGIGPGESFYVYESAAGELTVSRSVPSGDEVGSPVPEGVSEVNVAMYHPDVGTVYVSTLELVDSGS